MDLAGKSLAQRRMVELLERVDCLRLCCVDEEALEEETRTRRERISLVLTQKFGAGK